jgi:hypothetical protein
MTRLREAKWWQKALVFLLVADLLMVVALAASPQLHRLFHHDADHCDHECAVTVMISGGSDGSSTPPVFDAGTLLVQGFSFLAEIHPSDVPSIFLSAHIFEHAPPLA